MGKIRSILKNFDFILLFLTITICIYGIVIITSATSSYENPEKYVLIQSLALVAGLIFIYFMVMLDYEHLTGLSRYIYGFCIFILLLVLIPGIGTGREEMGGQSWIRFGALGFQPAEIVKIGFILTFSRHLSLVEDEINRPKNVLFLTLHFGAILGLILLQPDAGTAMVFIAMFLVMMFMAKLSYKYFIAGISAVLAFAPIAWFWIFQDYQRARILDFIYPENAPLTTGYQVLQSKIAVGAGQLLGKGLFKGSTQFGFLPERHNDFIFSVVCEELGLIGAMILILLLTLIILRCMYIARNAKNTLGMYIVSGVAAMLIFQSFENIGMCVGLMPVTGIPLPFVSYGGSSLLTNLTAIGLVLNVRYRYKTLNF